MLDGLSLTDPLLKAAKKRLTGKALQLQDKAAAALELQNHQSKDKAAAALELQDQQSKHEATQQNKSEPEASIPSESLETFDRQGLSSLSEPAGPLDHLESPLTSAEEVVPYLPGPLGEPPLKNLAASRDREIQAPLDSNAIEGRAEAVPTLWHEDSAQAALPEPHVKLVLVVRGDTCCCGKCGAKDS